MKEEKFIDKKARIEYTKQGDYYLPNLVMKKEKIPTGKYALMRYNYLKNHKNYELTMLIIDKKLTEHLTQIQTQAQEKVNLLVEQMARRENITEELKSKNQIEWVQKMNNIKNRAEEIVYKEIIFI